MRPSKGADRDRRRFPPSPARGGVSDMHGAVPAGCAGERTASMSTAVSDDLLPRSSLHANAVSEPPATTTFPGVGELDGDGRRRRPKERDVFLTWEDLRVAVSDGKGRSHILQGAAGYARPGEVLAIMGPSGCGKSTLLDALAGRLTNNSAGSRTLSAGRILVNGRRQTLALSTILCAYVTQDDILTSTLTVREAVYYSALLQLPDAMSSPEKKARAEEAIREMGLCCVADVKIGSSAAGLSLSGGQKRRVSICLEMLRRPRLLFLDEPTSGIDSAASYHVMSRIARLARNDGMTVVAALHQPSSEVFGLFHGLCLLSHGRTVFFGPPFSAAQFFAFNGFPCPLRRNPSDHYLRTINKDFDEDIEEGDNLGNVVVSTSDAINILVDSYRSSSIHLQVTERIKDINKMGSGSLVKKRSRASTFTQCLVLTRRSFTNMYRDIGYYWLRFMIYVAVCLCLGTIFHNAGESYDSIQARGTMLMFTVSFLTFMAIGGFPSFVEEVKIFGRERLNGHYGVLAFVVSNSVSCAPYLALISIIPGATAYYLAGLRKEIPNFAYFSLVVFACMMLVESLMMIVTAVVPDFLMGIIVGAGIQGIMMLSSGFFRLPRYLPHPVWRYPMYYVAFHRYANQGLCKNEFFGIRGEEILREAWGIDLSYSKWVDLAILFGMLLLYRLLFLTITMLADRVKPAMRACRPWPAAASLY